MIFFDLNDFHRLNMGFDVDKSKKSGQTLLLHFLLLLCFRRLSLITMDLPDSTDLLSFSGPEFLTIKGQKQSLPVPKYAPGTLSDASFKRQAQSDLYAERFVLRDVLEQRFVSYPSLVRLPGSGKKVLDLKVLRRRVTHTPGYGTKELIRDLKQMEGQVACTSTTKKNKKVGRQIWLFSYMKSKLIEEITEYENCPDCVGNYYIFDQPNCIPCRQPQ